MVSAGVEGLIKEYYDLIVPFIPTGYYDRAIFDANTEQKKNRYKGKRGFGKLCDSILFSRCGVQ